MSRERVLPPSPLPLPPAPKKGKKKVAVDVERVISDLQKSVEDGVARAAASLRDDAQMLEARTQVSVVTTKNATALDLPALIQQAEKSLGGTFTGRIFATVNPDGTWTLQVEVGDS
jgi:hypothetical protein